MWKIFKTEKNIEQCGELTLNDVQLVFISGILILAFIIIYIILMEFPIKSSSTKDIYTKKKKGKNK
ncbi:hypothetical protein [Saccharolobus islandicus]|uniref:Uncharacterized protein n=1 Tax=Saccharolobus islandicus (strain L.D.8.5 / Lassen \|nr:hypothetical protein [Sulfolobus islandicus]ADB87751.1 hypothetical protein LD85_2098 [Sulfolobus islandicus L.D.8.5]WCM38066.1 hypothetical protein GO599_11820 [Sulfolobus islandicus]